MPTLTKAQLAKQGSFDAVDYRVESGVDDDTYEAVLINLKIALDGKRAKEAKEFGQAIRFINKHAPDLPRNMKTRRLVIKHPKTEEALAEVVQVRGKVSAVIAKPAGTATKNVLSAPVANAVAKKPAAKPAAPKVQTPPKTHSPAA